MQDQLFTIDRFPAKYTLDFDAFLYNNPSHLLLQSENKRLDFFMIDHKRKKVVGRVSFFLMEGVAYSPFNSPFGSFELGGKVSLKMVFQFTAFVFTQLIEQGIKKIIIKSYAQVYAPEQSAKLSAALHHHGFSIHPVINHHITIDKVPFAEKIHKMERRKLKKCKAGGYQFSEEPINALSDIHAFIQQCRKEKGQPLNIGLSHLQKTAQSLPGKFKIFSVKEENALIAATIIVTVNQKVTYNFLPASLSNYNQQSPMVFLMANLYEYCRSNGISLLDLGISTTEGQQQFGLMKFKEHLGAESSLKFTFSRDEGI